MAHTHDANNAIHDLDMEREKNKRKTVFASLQSTVPGVEPDSTPGCGRSGKKGNDVLTRHNNAGTSLKPQQNCTKKIAGHFNTVSA